MLRYLIVLLLAGCAASTGVIPSGPDTFMISSRALTPGDTGNDALANAYREAGAFCADSGKELMPANFQVIDGGPGRWPNARLEFRCLSKGDPDLRRPSMEPPPTAIIEDRRKR